MQCGQNLFKIVFLVLEFHTHVIFEIRKYVNAWIQMHIQTNFELIV